MSSKRPDKPEPNVKLRKDAQPATVEGEVNAGMSKPIPLPSLEMQRKGFYSDRAEELIRLYPDRYIPFTDKGGNA